MDVVWRIDLCVENVLRTHIIKTCEAQLYLVSILIEEEIGKPASILLIIYYCIPYRTVRKCLNKL